jgi:hypothetical protein
MSYQKDYEQAAVEMKAALEDFRLAETRVAALQRRMAALHVLILGDNPPAADTPAGKQLAISQKILHATSRPVDQLRRIFARSEGPLTAKELRQELRKVGCDITQQTIGALCARLAEQGAIQRTQKAGKNAWEKVSIC